MDWHYDCFSVINCLCLCKIMKKLIITSLAFLFFLSTTGLPVSLHFCQMKNLTTFSDCEVCSSEKLEDEPACCSEETDFPEQIRSDNSNHCCETKIIESSVKDDYLSAASYLIHDFSSLLPAFQIDIVFPDFNSCKTYFHFNDSSPPFSTNNIYLINASFLI